MARLLLRASAAAGLSLALLLGAPLAAAQPDSRSDTRTLSHVLNRLAFGPRPGDIARVQSLGLDAFLDAQLHPDRIDDSALESRLERFVTLKLSTRQLAEDYFLPALELRRTAQANATPGAAGPAPSQDRRRARAAEAQVLAELSQARMLRAVYSERQLQEVMVDFWFNHFNVFAGKGQVRQHLVEYERDVIRPHVFGRFRDLLGAVAHSPAMLIYLDNWQSAAPPDAPRGPMPRAGAQLPGRGRGRAGNNPVTRPPAARDMLPRPAQTAARGLNENYARELLELHTLGVDGGYTQKDVVELARILTGWTIDRPRQGGGYVFRPAMHDYGSKTLLGTTIGPAGESEGERALDLLARHPSTARHISFKLAQRFVADDPPAALVERAADTFRETDGNIREVVRTILKSPEFLDASAYRAKVKTPLEFVVSAVRTTGINVPNAQPLVAALRNLGMPLYGAQPPTGYASTADAWVNTGAVLNRMNAAVSLTEGSAGAVAPGREVTPELRDRLVDQLLGGDVSDATQATLARATTPAELVALALGSPEFQRR